MRYLQFDFFRRWELVLDIHVPRQSHQVIDVLLNHQVGYLELETVSKNEAIYARYLERVTRTDELQLMLCYFVCVEDDGLIGGSMS